MHRPRDTDGEMTRRFLPVIVLALFACKQGDPPPAKRSSPTTRPTTITDADVQTMDQFLAALTSIDQAIRTEHECAKAARAVQDTAQKIAPMLPTVAQIDARTRKDNDAEAWAFANYGQKIKPLMEGIIGHECKSDPGYGAALALLQ